MGSAGACSFTELPCAGMLARHREQGMWEFAQAFGIAAKAFSGHFWAPVSQLGSGHPWLQIQRGGVPQHDLLPTQDAPTVFLATKLPRHLAGLGFIHTPHRRKQTHKALLVN